ncbi:MULTISPECIES: hypothetical protein [Enterococcus]|uniref:Uncharacterized protein n=1 Tax=Enterococcus thailandicus TaxID=417368 RepID=A0A179ETY2_ENTTH|nr:hypothetical protein [Enterococcus thailandicus]OAQ56329.1 hypothetical protein A6E74_02655 [Enterococcus thailandicus]OJG95836.1 hypothetical protein RV17_GL001019 [Enterococcus thailandicus]GEK36326.1 hypothetical protein ETH01_06130 [Enterococcus thailandicus]
MVKHKQEAEEPVDIWGRSPLQLYEKIGTPIKRATTSMNRSSNGELIHDYFVVFTDRKPDVRGYRELLQAAEWINYGTKIYRISTTNSFATIEKLVTETFDIQIKTDFFVSNSTVDPRFIN